MGLFSSSKSLTTQNVSTVDNRVAADQGSVALSGGSTFIQDTLADDVAIAAIQGATKTVDTGAGLVRDVNRDSLGFAAGIVDTAADAIGRVTDSVAGSFGKQLDTLSRSTSEAISNLEKNKRDPSDDTLQTVTKTVAVAAVVIVLGFIVLRRKAA